MNRQQFNEWLTDNDACSRAVQWCNEHPELSVQELIEICPRGEWILWLYAKAGYAPEVLAPVAYRAATRAIGYAVDTLDRAGVPHSLHGVVITDIESARAAARAAAARAAAEWDAQATARATAQATARAAAWAAQATAEWAAEAVRAAEWAAEAAARAAAWAARAAEQKLCADDCRELLPVWEVGK